MTRRRTPRGTPSGAGAPPPESRRRRGPGQAVLGLPHVWAEPPRGHAGEHRRGLLPGWATSRSGPSGTSRGRARFQASTRAGGAGVGQGHLQHVVVRPLVPGHPVRPVDHAPGGAPHQPPAPRPRGRPRRGGPGTRPRPAGWRPSPPWGPTSPPAWGTGPSTPPGTAVQSTPHTWEGSVSQGYAAVRSPGAEVAPLGRRGTRSNRKARSRPGQHRGAQLPLRVQDVQLQALPGHHVGAVVPVHLQRTGGGGVGLDHAAPGRAGRSRGPAPRLGGARRRRRPAAGGRGSPSPPARPWSAGRPPGPRWAPGPARTRGHRRGPPACPGPAPRRPGSPPRPAAEFSPGPLRACGSPGESGESTMLVTGLMASPPSRPWRRSSRWCGCGPSSGTAAWPPGPPGWSPGWSGPSGRWPGRSGCPSTRPPRWARW